MLKTSSEVLDVRPVTHETDLRLHTTPNHTCFCSRIELDGTNLRVHKVQGNWTMSYPMHQRPKSQEIF